MDNETKQVPKLVHEGPEIVTKVGGFKVADARGDSREEACNYARRIVACVNACVGISNEALNAGELHETLTTLNSSIGDLQGQRDELLEAAKEAIRFISSFEENERTEGRKGPAVECSDKLLSAIAKAEAGTNG